MAKTKRSSGTGSSSGKSSNGGGKTKTTKTAKLSEGSSSGSTGESSSSAGSQTNGAADALVKLIESPLVAELLAVGASAALASFAAQGFGRGTDDGRSTRRALKTAVKSAATAMGARLSTEVDEIRKASQKSKETEAA
jgi:hypothetical protein